MLAEFGRKGVANPAQAGTRLGDFHGKGVLSQQIAEIGAELVEIVPGRLRFTAIELRDDRRVGPRQFILPANDRLGLDNPGNLEQGLAKPLAHRQRVLQAAPQGDRLAEGRDQFGSELIDARGLAVSQRGIAFLSELVRLLVEVFHQGMAPLRKAVPYAAKGENLVPLAGAKLSLRLPPKMERHSGDGQAEAETDPR